MLKNWLEARALVLAYLGLHHPPEVFHRKVRRKCCLGVIASLGYTEDICITVTMLWWSANYTYIANTLYICVYV